MSRPGWTITNRDRNRKPHDDKLFVNVDKAWRTVDSGNFQEAIEWINSQFKKWSDK